MEKATLLRDRRLYVIFGITLMGVMGVSVISPAFPRISRALELSSAQVGLLITAFTVPGIFLAPVLGFWADRAGRKPILVPALLLFGIAGAGCAFTGSLPLLLVLRFLQGAGAASLTSLSITLLGDVYEGETRQRAVGYNASALSIGTAIYPAAGGALASLHWGAPFLLSLVALPIAAFVAFGLTNPEPEATTMTIGARLREVLRNAWSSGIALLSLLSVLLFILLYGAYLTYVPFLLDGRFELSSALVGAVMSTMSITTAVIASFRGRLASRFSAVALLAAAFLCYAAALLVFAVVSLWWMAVIATVLYGIGQGITVPTLQGEIAARAPLHLRGASLSVNAMSIRLGQTVGPVLAGAAFAAGSFTGVFAAGAAVAGLMAMITRVGSRQLREAEEQ